MGRAQAQARLFHSFSKAQAQIQLKPNLFNELFKPFKALSQSMKPEPNPSPKKLDPDPLLWTMTPEVNFDPGINFD
jgi:hypothetical protein